MKFSRKIRDSFAKDFGYSSAREFIKVLKDEKRYCIGDVPKILNKICWRGIVSYQEDYANLKVVIVLRCNKLSINNAIKKFKPLILNRIMKATYLQIEVRYEPLRFFECWFPRYRVIKI